MMFPCFTATVTVDPETLQRHARLVREALRLADVSLDTACLCMGIDPAQFHRQLQGEGNHLSFTRLMLLPAEFWKWFGVVTVESFGLPTRVLRASRLESAIRARRKQLSMVIRETRQLEKESA